MRRARWTVALATAFALVATACGAGQITQTSTARTATGGASGRIGSILIRDAQFAYPGSPAGDAAYRPGDDVPVVATIVNDATATQPDGSTPDRLTAVGSPIARSGRIVGEARIGDGQTLVAGRDRIPPGAKAVRVELVGLTEPIRAGLTYPVTFTFERAGPVRIELPVETPLRRTPS